VAAGVADSPGGADEPRTAGALLLAAAGGDGRGSGRLGEGLVAGAAAATRGAGGAGGVGGAFGAAGTGTVGTPGLAAVSSGFGSSMNSESPRFVATGGAALRGKNSAPIRSRWSARDTVIPIARGLRRTRIWAGRRMSLDYSAAAGG